LTAHQKKIGHFRSIWECPISYNEPASSLFMRRRAVTITRRGQPVLAILPWEFYESVVETLEILGDPEMVTALRESLDDLKRRRVVGNTEAKKRLGV
jgi:PHD/YefM family antitoxin component YafN of YafNO toxin-antitoxin module